jgi:hypothetical protein
MMITDKIPKGWHRLVAALRTEVERDFPQVEVTELTADRGWLYVRCADIDLTPPQRLRLDRVVQGYVTRSLSTCMRCGSHNGRDRRDRRSVTCDDCEKCETEARHA